MAETGAEAGIGEMTGGTSMELLPDSLAHSLEMALEALAIVIDLTGVAVLLMGFLVAVARASVVFMQGIGVRRDLADLSGIREALGVYILFGLELMIVSDIIHTMVSRQLSDLIFVGALVLIRTAIGFFLDREVREISAARREG